MSPSNDKFGNLDQLDAKADAIILKYSFMAGATGLIPAPGAASLIDTPLQLVMFNELSRNYRITANPLALNRFFFAIIDNLIAGKTVGWLMEALKGIPLIGQTLVPLAKSLWTFGFTYATGWVLKRLLRENCGGGLPTGTVVSSHLIADGWMQAVRSIIDHIKDILFGTKFVLNRYEVDLEALAKEFASLAEGIDAGNNQFSERHAKIESELQALGLTTGDMIKELERIARQIGMPSQDGLEAWANLAHFGGVEMRTVLQMIEEELRHGELPTSLKSLLPPPEEPDASTNIKS